MALQNVAWALTGRGLMDCLQYYDNCLFFLETGLASKDTQTQIVWERVIPVNHVHVRHAFFILSVIKIQLTLLYTEYINNVGAVFMYNIL
jgi:hypothetical protein